MLEPMTGSSNPQKNPPKAVNVGPWSFGGSQLQVIAGPCSVESKEQLLTIARSVRQSGATILRGGIHKMRTNPNSFQGLGDSGLPIVSDVKKELGLPVVCEITDPRQIEGFLEHVDFFQVGSRNMYNYALLKELGTIDRPILLKRGFSALIEEWVSAADYIRQGGNQNVVLCERGIRSFEKITRNTLDLAAVTWVKQNTDLPIVVDPSHATGIPSLIPALSLAAIAAGADGLIIEVHHQPEKALSDGHQALTLEAFQELMLEIKRVAPIFNRQLEAHLHV